MAIFVFGERAGGLVEVVDDTSVESVFAHFNGLPIRCRESHLVLGSRRFLVPRHRTSVRAGYLRSWAPIIASIFVFGATRSDDAWSLALNVVIAGALIAVWIWSLRDGRVTGDEAARRRVYRAVTGWPADPALLAYADPDVAERLRQELGARATRMAPDGYRDALAEWSTVATHAGGADASYLAIALTVARIEGNGALVDEIWARLRGVATTVPSLVAPPTPDLERIEESS